MHFMASDEAALVCSSHRAELVLTLALEVNCASLEDVLGHEALADHQQATTRSLCLGLIAPEPVGWKFLAAAHIAECAMQL